MKGLRTIGVLKTSLLSAPGSKKETFLHATNSNEKQNDTEIFSSKNIILRDFTQLHPFLN